jgi:hypothetical protein
MTEPDIFTQSPDGMKEKKLLEIYSHCFYSLPSSLSLSFFLHISLQFLAEFKEFFEYCNGQYGFADIKSISIENSSTHNLLLGVGILMSIPFRG